MPQQPVKRADLAAAVLAHQRPLLFLDAAAIPDIADSAATLVDDALADPKLVWVVTTANVIHEFNANRESINEDLSAQISKLNQSMVRVSSVAKILFRNAGSSLLNGPAQNSSNCSWGVMDRLVE